MEELMSAKKNPKDMSMAAYFSVASRTCATLNRSPLEVAYKLLKGYEILIDHFEGNVIPPGTKYLPTMEELQTVSSFKKSIYDENVRITFTDGSRATFGYKGLKVIKPAS